MHRMLPNTLLYTIADSSVSANNVSIPQIGNAMADVTILGDQLRPHRYSYLAGRVVFAQQPSNQLRSQNGHIISHNAIRTDVIRCSDVIRGSLGTELRPPAQLLSVF